MSDGNLITGLFTPHPSPSTALFPIAVLADIPEEDIRLLQFGMGLSDESIRDVS